VATEILTEAWASAWRDALNSSESYRTAAASWEGAVVVAVRAEPERGIKQTGRVPRSLARQLSRLPGGSRGRDAGGALRAHCARVHMD